MLTKSDQLTADPGHATGLPEISADLLKRYKAIWALSDLKYRKDMVLARLADCSSRTYDEAMSYRAALEALRQTQISIAPPPAVIQSFEAAADPLPDTKAETILAEVPIEEVPAQPPEELVPEINNDEIARAAEKATAQEIFDTLLWITDSTVAALQDRNSDLLATAYRQAFLIVAAFEDVDIGICAPFLARNLSSARTLLRYGCIAIQQRSRITTHHTRRLCEARNIDFEAVRKKFRAK